MKISLVSMFRGAIRDRGWKVLFEKELYKLATRTLLNKWGLYKFPVRYLYMGFLRRDFGEQILLQTLFPEQVEEFISFHEAMRNKWLDGTFDPKMATRFAQIGNMIDRDLEANIVRKRRGVNVVKRVN
jgi:hypothetical protein